MTTTSTRCPLCKTMVLTTDHSCQTCGFPVHGSSIEKEDFKRVRAEKRKTLDKARNSVRWAQAVLALSTFFTLIVGVVIFSDYLEATGFVADFMLPGVIRVGILFLAYLGLTIFSNFKPYPAIVVGFAIFLLSNLWAAVINPASLTEGLVVKVLFLAAFIKGIYSVATMETLDEELDHWKKK